MTAPSSLFAILPAYLLVSDPCRVGCKPPSLLGFFVELVLNLLFPQRGSFLERCDGTLDIFFGIEHRKCSTPFNSTVRTACFCQFFCISLLFFLLTLFLKLPSLLSSSPTVSHNFLLPTELLHSASCLHSEHHPEAAVVPPTCCMITNRKKTCRPFSLGSNLSSFSFPSFSPRSFFLLPFFGLLSLPLAPTPPIPISPPSSYLPFATYPTVVLLLTFFLYDSAPCDSYTF